MVAPLLTLVPVLAPLILEALDGWFNSGKLSKADYDKAKALYTQAHERSTAAVDDFNKWLEEPE